MTEDLSKTRQLMVKVCSRITVLVYLLIALLLVAAVVIAASDAIFWLVNAATMAGTLGIADDLLTSSIQAILVIIVLATLIDMVRSYVRYGRVLVRPILVAGITTTVRRLMVSTLTLTDIIGIAIIIIVLTVAIIFLGREDRRVAKCGEGDEHLFSFLSKKKKTPDDGHKGTVTEQKSTE